MHRTAAGLTALDPCYSGPHSGRYWLAAARPRNQTAMANTEQLVDSFGRVHRNLRVSVTDRCNIRCYYCMPAENVVFMARRELLSFEEIERFVRVVARLGVDKLRLTGGEPLVRRELPVLVAKLSRIAGIDDLGLTTNGVLLKPIAQELYEAGLRRINISLDTLRAEKFREITRRDGFEKVLEGIFEAKRVGFDPVKINAVAIRGVTEEEVVPMARFAREHDVEMRFIEFMPLDAENRWERGKVLFAQEILDILAEGIGPLEPAANQDPRAPASRYVFADGVGQIGIIASVSRPFCMSCDRLRLTADGKLRNCLFAHDELDVKALLRGNGTDEEIAALVHRSVGAKKEGHEINTARFVQPPRPMHSIGG